MTQFQIEVLFGTAWYPVGPPEKSLDKAWWAASEWRQANKMPTDQFIRVVEEKAMDREDTAEALLKLARKILSTGEDFC